MTKSREIIFGMDAQKRICEGLELTARAVKATLGPKGKNVLIQTATGYQFTKDGITVAKNVFFDDKFANLGAMLAKEAGHRSVVAAGDGTTSTITLLDAIVREGQKQIAMKRDPMSIRRGLEAASKKAVEWVKGRSTPVSGSDDLRRVATISANGDEKIGAIIADVLEKVGHAATVTLEEGTTAETKVEQTRGFEFDRGMVHNVFSRDNARLRTVYSEDVMKIPEDPTSAYVWLVNGRMNSMSEEALAILNAVHKTGVPLIIIAEAIEGEILKILADSRMRGVLNCVPIKAPGFGADRREMLEDLAALTGATLRQPDRGQDLYKDFSLSELGRVRHAEIYPEKTVIIPSDKFAELVERRVDQIDAALEEATDSDVRHRLTRRKSILTGGVANIKVGGKSDAEIRERRDLFEDALLAARAAVETGIVPGAGTTLVRASDALADFKIGHEDQDVGVQILRNAMLAPFQEIIKNGGGSSEVILNAVRENKDLSFGYDSSSDQYCNLLERGIVDPTKVVVSEIEHACSMAGLVLSTDVVIGIEPETPPQK